MNMFAFRSKRTSSDVTRLFFSSKHVGKPTNLFALLTKAKKSNNFDDAFQVASKMVLDKVLPRHYSMTAINIFKLSKHPDYCLKVLDMFPATELGSRQFNATITSLGHEGKTQEAIEVFERMHEQGIPWDIYSFNAAIHACQKGGDREMGLKLLEEMKRTGVPPNSITYRICRGWIWGYGDE